MLHPNSTETTPREFDAMNHEKEMSELNYAHIQRLKQMELEAAKLEAKWASWIKLPKTLLLLPVYCLMAIGYIVSSFREDNEPGQNFWDLFRK